jgi:hypothetical protein
LSRCTNPIVLSGRSRSGVNEKRRASYGFR